MRRIAKFVSVALALAGIGSLVAGQNQLVTVAWAAAAVQQSAASPISEDTPDNVDGEDPPEGPAVVDPVPQDDGTDGVDDGTGDGS